MGPFIITRSQGAQKSHHIIWIRVLIWISTELEKRKNRQPKSKKIEKFRKKSDNAAYWKRRRCRQCSQQLKQGSKKQKSNFFIRTKSQNIQQNGQKPIKNLFGPKSHSNPSSRRERRKSDRRRPRKIAQIVASEVETDFWRISHHLIMKLTIWQFKISKIDLQQKKIKKYFLLSEKY